MIRCLSLLCSIALCLTSFTGPVFSAALEVNSSEEDLLFGEIPVVITASKSKQKINKAPSVITVVTAGDIKRMGAVTLDDVLKRVVGFYIVPSRTRAGIITSRGMDADSNHQYLYLLDGHNLNSVNGWGNIEQNSVPLLANIDRIEIIRGPGSTLWGGDAVLGIINIITRSGKEVDGIRVKTDYALTDGNSRSVQSINMGKEVSPDTAFSLAANYYQSDGYGEPGGNPNVLHRPDRSDRTNPTLNYVNWNVWRPSYEIFAKVKSGKFTIMGRDFFREYLDDTTNPNSGFTVTRRLETSFLEAQYLTDLGENTTFETKLFTDRQNKMRAPVNGFGNGTLEAYEERGYGVDALLSTLIGAHQLKVGARSVTTICGQNLLMSYDYSASSATAIAGTMRRTDGGTDTSYGIFIDDQYDLFDNFTIIAGARIDANNYRDTTSKIIPRAALIYGITDKLTAKYVYNTGFVRPAVNQGRRRGIDTSLGGGLVVDPYNATKSQEIYAHDAQLSFKDGKTDFNVTLFQYTVKDYITFVRRPSGYANVSDANANGIEVDFRRSVTDNIAVYGNYSWALAKLDSSAFIAAPSTIGPGATGVTNYDKEWMSQPRQMVNLGVDLNLPGNAVLNMHYNGWREMDVYAYSDEARRSAIRHLTGNDYLDANLLFREVMGTPLTLSLYCTNLFDHRGMEPIQGIAGWKLSQGRTAGLNASYRFGL